MNGYIVEPEDMSTFWPKVDKTATCWNWTGSKERKGYGRFGFRRNGKSMMFSAHRLAYQMTVAPIPEGMVIDHTCHNPSCVNPGHMRVATYKQNNENLLRAQTRNASGIRGVTWHAPSKMWRARVGHMGEQYHLGSFKSKEEAGEAAKAKRLELFTHSDMDRVA